MDLPVQSEEESFPIAFFSSSYQTSLQPLSLSAQSFPNFITNIWIAPILPQSQAIGAPEHYRLDQQLTLYVQRNPHGLPIIQIAVFDYVPKGWHQISISPQPSLPTRSTLAYLKLNTTQKCAIVDSIKVQKKVQENKSLQTTQPTLSDNQESFNLNQINFENVRILFTTRSVPRQQIQKTYFHLVPKSQILYHRNRSVIYKEDLDQMSFPQGIKVTRMSSGYRFVNFLLTTESGDRFYCNSLVFSEQFSKETSKYLQNAYNIQTESGQLFYEKSFLFYSEYSCTDQINQCLEHLYRIYLSQPFSNFQAIVNNFDTNFIINRTTLKVRYQDPHYALQFKVNTSYPTISNNAIYSIFKFMEVHNIITILESILLEEDIFFISESSSIIGYFIQAFVSFIFPLRWIHPIVPTLSEKNLFLVEAPFSLIYGVSNKLIPQIQERVKKGVFVYLDENRVHTVNPNKMKKIGLKQNLRHQIIERLQKYSAYDPIDVRDYLLSPDNLSMFKTRKTEDPHFDPLVIRNIFFELLVFLLKDYKQYFKEPVLTSNERSPSRQSITKIYDLKRLKDFHKKDKFMLEFFETTLFSVLLETKLQNPDDKWIKTLDRAIRKISKFKKNFILEESDNNQTEGEEAIEQPDDQVPKGCLLLINNFSKQSSTQDRTPCISPKLSMKSNSSERKSIQSKKSEKSEKISMRFSIDSRSSSKQDRETSVGNRLSQDAIPELTDEIEIRMVVSDAAGKEIETEEGMSHTICRFLSYPVVLAKQSTAAKWSKKKYKGLKQWMKKDNKVKRDMSQKQEEICKEQ